MLLKYLYILFPAGILAGMASSVAGLASLFSYPALLLAGIPPVSANITNTTALIFTGIGSTVSSTRELKGNMRALRKLLPLSALGGLCGGIFLLAAPAKSFEYVVPFFILGAAILILWPQLPLPHAGKTPRAAEKSAKYRRAAAVLCGAAIFLVSAYTGYFGAAGGVVMLAILAATSRLPFAEYNALKNASLGVSNLVAALLFIFRGHIYWLAALPLAAGFFIGGFIGPSIVRRVPSRALNFLIGTAAVALSVYLFIRTYFG